MTNDMEAEKACVFSFYSTGVIIEKHKLNSFWLRNPTEKEEIILNISSWIQQQNAQRKSRHS